VTDFIKCYELTVGVMRNVKFGLAAGVDSVGGGFALPTSPDLFSGYALGFGRRNGITGRSLNPSLRDRMICFRRCGKERRR
jgi:hypothetical protein